MSTRALLELPRSEVFKWSAVYLASRQGLKRDIFGGEVFANTDIQKWTCGECYRALQVDCG